MINSCLAPLEAVALLKHLQNDCVFREITHYREFFIVDWSWVVATIELSNSIFLSSLIQIHNPGVKHLPDPCCALALQIYRRLTLCPIDEIHSAIVTRVAHVTESSITGVQVVFAPCPVVALKIAVDEHLWDLNYAQGKKQANKRVLQFKVVLDTWSVFEEKILFIARLELHAFAFSRKTTSSRNIIIFSIQLSVFGMQIIV